MMHIEIYFVANKYNLKYQKHYKKNELLFQLVLDFEFLDNLLCYYFTLYTSSPVLLSNCVLQIKL